MLKCIWTASFLYREICWCRLYLQIFYWVGGSVVAFHDCLGHPFPNVADLYVSIVGGVFAMKDGWSSAYTGCIIYWLALIKASSFDSMLQRAFLVVCMESFCILSYCALSVCKNYSMVHWRSTPLSWYSLRSILCLEILRLLYFRLLQFRLVGRCAPRLDVCY